MDDNDFMLVAGLGDTVPSLPCVVGKKYKLTVTISPLTEQGKKNTEEARWIIIASGRNLLIEPQEVKTVEVERQGSSFEYDVTPIQEGEFCLTVDFLWKTTWVNRLQFFRQSMGRFPTKNAATG